MRACDSISPQTERGTAQVLDIAAAHVPARAPARRRSVRRSVIDRRRQSRGRTACGSALQALADPDANRAATIFRGVLVQSPADNPVSYRRGPVGDWLVPETVDPQDASIRVLLLTPDGPLYVRIEALIDNRPFRAITEEWIDSALARTEPVAKTGATDAAQAAAGAKMAKSPFQKTKVPAWLAQYVRDSAAPVERFEARWLIAQRGGGPALLELERFSSNRSAAAPSCISSMPTATARCRRPRSLRRRRGSPSATSTRTAAWTSPSSNARGRARIPRTSPGAEPLLLVIDEQTDWEALAQSVQARYAGTAGAAKAPDVESLKRLVDGAAEIAVRVRFGADKESAGVELVGFESASFTDKSRAAGKTRSLSLSAQRRGGFRRSDRRAVGSGAGFGWRGR